MNIMEKPPLYISRIALRFCILRFFLINSHCTATGICRSLDLDSEKDKDAILMIKNELYYMDYNSLIVSTWNDQECCAEYNISSAWVFDITAGITEFRQSYLVSHDIILNRSLNDFMDNFSRCILYGKPPTH